MFAGEIARVLGLADEVFLLPVYSAGEHETAHSTSEEITQHNAKIIPVNFENVYEFLKAALKPDDLFLTMGAGDVYMIGEKFLSCE